MSWPRRRRTVRRRTRRCEALYAHNAAVNCWARQRASPPRRRSKGLPRRIRPRRWSPNSSKSRCRICAETRRSCESRTRRRIPSPAAHRSQARSLCGRPRGTRRRQEGPTGRTGPRSGAGCARRPPRCHRRRLAPKGALALGPVPLVCGLLAFSPVWRLPARRRIATAFSPFGSTPPHPSTGAGPNKRSRR